MSDVLPGAGQPPPAVGRAAAEGSNDVLTGHEPAGGGAGEPGADSGGEPSPGLTGPDEAGAGGDSAASGSRPGKNKRRRWLLSWVGVIVLGAVVALGLRLFVVQTFFVPSGSMIPTLQIGDRMLVLKVGYSVQRGAVVVFRRPPGDLSDPNQDDLVKRVIGLPGETIWSVGNTVYINGRPLAEPWLPRNDPLGPPITRQRIPKGDYFMMGDNRADSYDSRDWGPLPRSYIIGRVFVVIWRNGKPDFHVI
jgi:signal peptidase I